MFTFAKDKNRTMSQKNNPDGINPMTHFLKDFEKNCRIHLEGQFILPVTPQECTEKCQNRKAHKLGPGNNIRA